MNKIVKYNISKSGNDGSNKTYGSGQNSASGSLYSNSSSDTAKQLAETHNIWGQPFNGTQDVAGDLSNVENIYAAGDVFVNDYVDDEGVHGGNITAAHVVTAEKFVGDLEANKINANIGRIGYLDGDDLNYLRGVIEDLQSGNITTEYLTVTKQAHFFELIIDKIKAAGGAVLLTPADGFKIDKVKIVNNSPRYYKLYWKASDGEKARSNMWQIGDQAICQTFNNAQVGTNYNISNKYYWTLVSSVGTENIDGEDYHFIQVAGSDGINVGYYDGLVNPEVGDEIAMLGYRGTDDPERQSAIYLAAYNSIDKDLKAPLICHYKGINDFNLASHKYTWFAANGSTIRGDVKMENGESVEDAVNQGSIKSIVVDYSVSTSMTTTPTFWQKNVPNVPQGSYLWTRTTTTYGDGSTSVSYSVSRIGNDGQKGDKGNAGNDGTSCNINLLTGTREFSGDGWINLQYWTETNEYYQGCKAYKRASNQYGPYKLFYAEIGKTYTFSSYVKVDGDADARMYFTITSEAGVVTPLQKDTPESNGWTRIACKFTCTTEGYIGCRIQKATGTGTVYIAGYKIEEGDAEANTIWMPAASEMLGADYYTLNPVKEVAQVNLDRSLSIDFQYEILHVEGDKTTVVPEDGRNITVRYCDNSANLWRTIQGETSPHVKVDKYVVTYDDWYDLTYFYVELMVQGVVVCRRIIPVIFQPYAILEITDNIDMRVGNLQGDIGQIKVEANQITERVNDIELRITDKKIILNGDTEVNGVVTINQDGTGFKLQGSNGQYFSIGTDDIGSYSKFEATSLNSWMHTVTYSTYYVFSNSATPSQHSYGFKHNSYLGYLKAGERFRITNLGFIPTNSNTLWGQINVSLYRGDTGDPESDWQLIQSFGIPGTLYPNQWYQGSKTFTGSKQAIIDFVPTKSDDYIVQISGVLRGVDYTVGAVQFQLCCDNKADVYGMLTYNGLGFQLGDGKNFYVGSDQMLMQTSGTTGIRVTPETGVERLIGADTWAPVGLENKRIRKVIDNFIDGPTANNTRYVITTQDDMIVATYMTSSIILNLPLPATCPGKEYIIKNRTSSDELYVCGGTYSTNNAAGNIIQPASNSGYNNSKTIKVNGSNVTYYGLMKCNRNTHLLISDGEYWIDGILTT